MIFIKKNKTITIMLALLLIIVLTGCNNQEKNNDEVISFTSEKEVFVGDVNIRDFYLNDEENIKLAKEYINTTFDDFKYLDYNDNEYNTNLLEGNKIIYFTSPYCEACNISIEHVNKFEELYEIPLISLTDIKDMNGYNNYKKAGYNKELYYIQKEEIDMKDKYVNQGTPFFIFLDENNKVILTRLGNIDFEYLEELYRTAYE